MCLLFFGATTAVSDAGSGGGLILPSFPFFCDASLLNILKCHEIQQGKSKFKGKINITQEILFEIV
jgi:hypothetical protein